MTNKKLKLAAMSVALTACVAAQPMAAHAVDAPDTAEDDNAARQTAPAKDAAAETGTAETKADEAAEPQENFEAPVNEEAPENKQLPAFGPGVDSSDVEIDYGEPQPDPDKGNTTITEGEVIDKSQKDETTGEAGKEIGDATKTETEDPGSTTTEVTPSTDPDDVLGKGADGSTLVKGTETTITEGKGEAESTTKTDPEEKEISSLEDELGTNYRDKLNWDISDKADEAGNKTAIGDYHVDTVTDSADGDSKDVTLKKTKRTEGRLSAEEIQKLLDADDLETKEETDAEGNVKTTYTLKTVEPITDADGKVIGTRTTYYEVTGDKVTTITETTLTVTVAKGTETGKVDKTTEIKLPDITVKNKNTDETMKISSSLLDDILKDPNNYQGGNTYTYTEEIKNTDGTTTTRDYTITVDDSKTEGLGNKDIADLLGDGFTGDESGVYYKGEKLTTDELTAVRRTLRYDVTVNETTRKPDQVAEGSDLSGSMAEAEAKAKLEALRNALIEAAKKAGIELSEDELNRVTLDGDHLTVSRTDNTSDTIYNYTFSYKGEDITTVSNSTKTGETTVNGKDAENVEETIVSGTAYVTGGSKTWEGSGSFSNTVDGKLADGISSDFTIPEGITPKKEETINGIRTVVYEYNGKTYTLTYTTPDENQMARIKADLEKKLRDEGKTSDEISAILSNEQFQWVSWTVTEADKDVPDVIEETEKDLRKGDFWHYDEASKTLTIYDEKGNVKERYTNLTYTNGKYIGKDANNPNISYEITPSSRLLEKEEIKELLKDYGDVDIIDANTVEYVKDGKRYTLKISNLGLNTIEVKKYEKSTISNASEADLRAAIDRELKSLKDGEGLKVGNQIITKDNGKYWLDGAEAKTETIETIIKEAIHSFVDFDSLSREELIKLLEEEKAAADKAGHSYTESTGFNHADLDIETSLKDENGNDLGEAFIIGSPEYKLGHDAGNVVDGNAAGPNLASNATYDSSSGKMEYRGTDYSYNANNYYSVTGKVAYDKDASYSDWRTAQQQAETRAEELRKAGYTTAVAVQTGNGTWTVFKHTADLIAYGYMDSDSNTCRDKPTPAAPSTQKGGHEKPDGGHYGYDLLLKNLTLVNGKVIAQSKTTYSATLTKISSTNAAYEALKLNSLSHKEPSAPLTGNGYSGTYNVTFRQSFDWKKGTCSEAKGTGEGRFKSFTELLKKLFSGSGSTTRDEAKGSYSYKTTDKDKLEISAVSKVEQTTTVAHVDYNYTTVSEKETTVVIPPVTPPEEPEPPIKDETPVTPDTPELPPVQDAAPDEVIAPASPELPPVQDAAALPQTGVNWLTALGMAFSGLTLMIMGAFTSLKYKEKH